MSVEQREIVIVGGGPAGAAAATELVREGADVLVLDRQRFPRTKLCAGWITPQVVEDLDLDIDAYPYRFNTFDDIVVHMKGLTFNLATPQHSIRRYEFDRYLLDRSEAEVRRHDVRQIAENGDGFLIDEQLSCKYLIGAGGTRCPVYRTLFRESNPRARELQAAAYEHEFPYEWHDPRCHLWFFDHGLPGYSWYVPKADGYLNCGVGGMAEKLKARGDSIKDHWRFHIDELVDKNFIEAVDLQPKGYSYYLRDGVDTVRRGNAFVTGDAVGLATRDLCEGIGPAIVSGQLAARAITKGAEYSTATIGEFSSGYWLARKLLEYMLITRPTAAVGSRKLRASSGETG